MELRSERKCKVFRGHGLRINPELSEIPDGDTCLSHGVREGGRCKCQPHFYGDHCQYAEDCSSDKDCGANGLCQVTSDTAEKQCFCAGGLFGDNCQKESPAMKSASEFDESLYNMKEAEDNKIYWRIVSVSCAE
ncbi:EGF-like domain protein [Ancylostoma caninum]|uniref:EGF-like domain protein n=1 Tax=Ancylostoma caninum TaxID=29170 RepID=A0A368FAN4_ANCCA|nr:EGF-like domain protein [Ancylostoma caninum]